MTASNNDPVPPLGHRSQTPDVTAPDGSEIRLLVDGRQGAFKSSLVEVTLGPGRVTRPVRHRSVEEVWYVLEGAGMVWRCPPDAEPVTVPAMNVKLGDALVIGPSMPLAWNVEAAALYRKAAAAAGRKPEIILMRDAWVADSVADAARVYGPEVMAAYKYYWRAGSEAFKDVESLDAFEFESMAKDRIITGSPEACIAEFKRWSEAVGTDYFLLRLRHAHSGGPPHQEILKAIERFGRDVIPHLAG